jgi:hypothetical protein
MSFYQKTNYFNFGISKGRKKNFNSKRVPMVSEQSKADGDENICIIQFYKAIPFIILRNVIIKS